VSFLPPRGSCVRARSKDAALLLFSLSSPSRSPSHTPVCVSSPPSLPPPPSPCPFTAPRRPFARPHVLSFPPSPPPTPSPHPPARPPLFISAYADYATVSSRTPPLLRLSPCGIAAYALREQRLSADATIISCRMLIVFFDVLCAMERWSLAMELDADGGAVRWCTLSTVNRDDCEDARDASSRDFRF